MEEKQKRKAGRPHGSVVYTDEAIAKALRENGGMPTKAAEVLGCDYITVYTRVKASKELQIIQQAARSRLFDDLQSLTISAVRTGLMPQLLPGDDGDVARDEDGKPVKTHVPVDPQTRLATAAKIMGVLKGEAGIVDKAEVKNEHSGGIAIIVDGEDAKLGDR